MFTDIRKVIILLCSTILLFACTDSEKEGKNQEQNKIQHEEAGSEKVDSSKPFQIQSPKLPTTIEEVIDYPVGPFGSQNITIKDANVQQVLSDIPPFSEEATEEEMNKLFTYLYSLFKMEYEDPKDALIDYSIHENESLKTVNHEEQQGFFNVEIILDSSESMGSTIDGKTRLEWTKDSIQNFASTLPEEVNMSLRVYGHQGTSATEDKAKSCSANELVYSPQPYNKEKLDEALDSLKPAGWKPFAASLLKAQEDLASYTGENDKNIIYIVSDGMETCDGDPIAAAESLKESGTAPIVHIIGFDATSKDQQQLEEIANAAGGTYTNVKNQQQLQQEFDKTIQQATEWLGLKGKEKTNIFSHSVQQANNILTSYNEWNLNNTKEKSMITNALSKLEMDHKITSKQKYQIVDMYNSFYKGQKKALDELKSVLDHATWEQREIIHEKLDEIYKENFS